MNLPSILAFAAMATLCAAASAQRPDPATWRDLKPDLSRDAVKRMNDRYPLSDQRNTGKWTPYRPLWDEFAGRKLDAAKWHDTNPTWKGRQPAPFLASNVEVRDGKLHLTMRKEDPPEALRSEGYHTFTSAAVQSKERVLYGYFEVRARHAVPRSAPSGLTTQSRSSWTEIDVFRSAAGAGVRAQALHHRAPVSYATEKQHCRSRSSPPGRLRDYQVYGLEWDEKELNSTSTARSCGWTEPHWHQALR